MPTQFILDRKQQEAEQTIQDILDLTKKRPYPTKETIHLARFVDACFYVIEDLKSKDEQTKQEEKQKKEVKEAEKQRKILEEQRKKEQKKKKKKKKKKCRKKILNETIAFLTIRLS